MPTFAWRAATTTGRVLSGREDALTAAALERALGERGMLPLQIAPVALQAQRRAAPRRSRRGDVVAAMRYLATLSDAGFPLDRALRATARAVSRGDVAEAVRAVQTQVQTGAHFADALAGHPRIFPQLCVGMARAGERGGYLAAALARLAEQLEREQALRSRVISAMLYPLILAVVGGLALVLLFVYVLPRFVAVLAEAGSTLPRSTEMLLAAGDFVAGWWPLLLLVPAVTATVIAAYARTARGRLAIDGLLLQLPVVGSLRRDMAAVRLGRSLGTLLDAGLPILPALDIAADALADAAAGAAVRQVREDVRIGSRFAGALARPALFPDLLVQMAEVGEEGGRLPEMLERAAQALEAELERRLERLVRLAEPVMILLFGGAIGFVALALLQAIYGMSPDTLQNP